MNMRSSYCFLVSIRPPYIALARFGSRPGGCEQSRNISNRSTLVLSKRQRRNGGDATPLSGRKGSTPLEMMIMKKLLVTAALSAAIGLGTLGTLVATSTPADAAVVCNRYGDCWRTTS